MPPKKNDLGERLAEMRLKSKASDEKAKVIEKAEASARAKPPTEREQKAATTIQRAFRKKKDSETKEGKVRKRAQEFVKYVAGESRKKEATAFHPDGAMAHMEHNNSMADRAVEVMDRNRDRIPTFKYQEHNAFWEREKKGITKTTEPFLLKHFNFYKHFKDNKKIIPSADDPKFVKNVMDRGYFLQDPRANVKIKYMAVEPVDLEVMKEVLPRPGAEGVPLRPMTSGGKVPSGGKKK
jgi:hypothetical protein